MEVDGVLYASQWYNALDSTGRNLWYYYTENGSLFRNAWYKSVENGVETWEYYGDDCGEYYGYQTIKGKNYYFDPYSGQLKKNAVVESDDGNTYVCDKSGIATRLPENGWASAGGNYFYMENNTRVKNDVRKIKNVWYGFDEDGKMYDNRAFTLYRIVDGKMQVDSFRAKAGGALYTGTWYEDTEWHDKFYYQSDARAAVGACTIDNKLYVFLSNGVLQLGSTTKVDGKLYLSAENGEAVLMPEGKWTKFKGKWYYNPSGYLVTDAVTEIGGKTYVFGHDGRLYE